MKKTSIIKREISANRKQAIRQSDNYKTTKPLLELYITNILKLSDKKGWLKTPYETFEENCVDFSKKWVETIEISNILRGLKSEVNYNSSKHEAMSKMLAFMGLVESIGISMADMLLVLLIANEKAVHTRGKNVWHVTSFKELKDIDWDYKKTFLKKEGFQIIEPILNLDLRNTIAHIKFKLVENGRITDNSNTVINIDDKINDFWNGIDTLIVLFEDLGLLKWLDERLSQKRETVKDMQNMEANNTHDDKIINSP